MSRIVGLFAVNSLLAPLLFLVLQILSSPSLAQDPASLYEDALRLRSSGQSTSALIQLKNALKADSQDIPSLLLFADLSLQLGSTGDALEAVNEALLAGADPALAIPILAEVYLALGSYRRLLDELDPITIAGDARAELLALRSMAFRALGRSANADASLQEAIELFPNSRAVRIAKVELFRSRNDKVSELSAAQSLAKDFPRDARIQVLLAAALLHADDSSGALAAYSEAIQIAPSMTKARLGRASIRLLEGDASGAMSDVDAILVSSPDDPRALFLKAQMLESAGDDEGAQLYFQSSVDVLSSVDSEALAQDRQLTLLAVVAAAKFESTERAIRLLQTYQSRHPDDSETAELLVDLLIRNGESGAALKALVPLLVDSPSSESLRMLKAQALSMQGRHWEALEIWTELRGQLKPDLVDAEIAILQLMVGNVDDGIVSLQSALVHAPEDEVSLYRLAVAHLARGSHAEAVAIAEKLVGDTPSNEAYTLLLAKGLADSGQATDAQTTLSAWLSNHGESRSISLALGRLQALDGKFAEAAATFESLLHKSSEDPEVLLELGRTAQAAGNFPLARKWLERALAADGQNLAAGRELVQVLQTQGDSLATVEVAESVYKRNGSIEARMFYAKTLASAERSTDAVSQLVLIARDQEATPEVLFEVAGLQKQLGALGNASSTLYQLNSKVSDNLRYQLASLDVDMRLENYDEVIAESDRMIEKFPSSAGPFVFRARAELASGGSASKALEFFDSARQRDPGNRGLMFEHYRAKIAVGDRDSAQTVLSEWIENNPADKRALFVLSGHLQQGGAFAQSLQILKRLDESSPDNPLVLNNMALAMYELGDERAEQVARKAVSLSPDAYQVNDTLGWMLVRSGRAEEALVYLRRAASRNSTDSAVRYHLAKALFDLERFDEASKELEVALRAQVSWPEKKEAEALLGQL